MFVTVKEAAFGEDYVLKFCGKHTQEVWHRKPRVVVASDQADIYIYIYRERERERGGG